MSSAVTVVIPARDSASTIGACLESLRRFIDGGDVHEVILVDDGSNDATGEISRRFPIRYVRGRGEGAGAARNLGWRAARTSLIWFVDSDCVVEPDALEILLPHLDDPQVAAVGGSYGNMRPDSLLACLIHEEIVERHLRMPSTVNFLATFNVLYRRDVLQQVGGFSEEFLKAQDAELAYRVRDTGAALRFDARSRVKHFHESRLRPYLKVQRSQGYWRAWLYAKHPERARGDSYSGWADHVQPPLALAAVAGAPLLLLGPLALGELGVLGGLLAVQLPMTARLLLRTRDVRMLAYAPMGMVRSFARAYGFVQGVVECATARTRSRASAAERAR